MTPREKFTIEEAKDIADDLGIDYVDGPFDLEQFRMGPGVELKHGTHDPETDVTGDDPIITGKIALAHLRELPDYYTRLAGDGKRGREMTRMPPRVDLFWLPLGAGGHFVRFNGRVYEAIQARREHRERRDLYHTALLITLPEGRWVVENAWPIPDDDGPCRGVVVEGPVGSSLIGHFRVLRYEIRCWGEGVISDIAEAVASPQLISNDERIARRILGLVDRVPPLVWGRRPSPTAEMWNSNSVISWLLARSGAPIKEIDAPDGGRAPGWSTGIQLAEMSSVLELETAAI